MTKQKSAFGCLNNTIRLRSGRYFNLANPRPDDFTFSDIAGALSKICRFGGQIDCFYSVAEHLYNCCKQAADDNLPIYVKKAVLLHDATEAFVGDMVKPLKIMLPAYSEIEARVESAIAEKFKVVFTWPAVKKIDREMLIAEKRAMFSRDGVAWTGESEVRQIVFNLAKWRPIDAESAFTRMAGEIGIDVTR